ncbi:MAG: Chaperonin (heat shock protein 33) [Hydrogenibacillus schlegelii]|uniref:33 kDa chaperonin n=1 Tax=Hydrogenibacillus schlegelii TaxID=1484 RepID=A0A2T5GA19_HYDSH|nr:Hsp33 family molecular chaperone HslO [Hydrogenibacillus schlegelii]PTQ53031.1 MAG: Chaperonin (heat shock protein 33) [Hydrogenibacillus schlegelii]
MDALYRGLALDGRVRLFVLRLTETVREAARHVETRPTASAALGRAMAAAVLYAAGTKTADAIHLLIAGDGPLGRVVADAFRLPDGALGARGLVERPEIDLPPRSDGKLDVGGAVGRRGTLVVARELAGGPPYRGTAPLVSGEIGEDFAFYLLTSEQIPSAVGLGVLVAGDHTVEAAGGFWLHPLPGAEGEVLEVLEARLREAPPVTTLLRRTPFPEAAAQALVGEAGHWETVEPVRFYCTCSEAKAARTLRLLGPKALEEEAARGRPLEVRCGFCRRRYPFPPAALRRLAETVRPGAEEGRDGT